MLGIVLYHPRASLVIIIFYRFSWWKIILILVVIVGTISYTFNNIKELIDGIEEYRNYIKRAGAPVRPLFCAGKYIPPLPKARRLQSKFFPIVN